MYIVKKKQKNPGGTGTLPFLMRGGDSDFSTIQNTYYRKNVSKLCPKNDFYINFCLESY